MTRNDINSTDIKKATNVRWQKELSFILYTASVGSRFHNDGGGDSKENQDSRSKRILCAQVFCKRTRFTGDNSY